VLGAGVLCHVGQGLGDDEVGARLDLRGQARVGDDNWDRHVKTRHQRAQAPAQAAPGQRGGEETVRQVA
jgi:hypothetical protein